MKLVKNWLLIILLSCGAIDLAVYAAADELSEAEASGALLTEEQKQRREQEALQEEEIKEGAEEQKLPEKRIQLLSVFLDNKEARPGSTHSAVTHALAAALLSKAGPIITTGSLVYNLFEGPFTQQGDENDDSKKIAHECKAAFNKGEDWIITSCGWCLWMLIPRSYLHEQKMTVNTVGLQIGEEYTLENIMKEISQLSPEEWGNAGSIFIEALFKNAIFNVQEPNRSWVIYVNGHGTYGATIAGIPFNEFSRFLDYCSTYIDVALFIYYSCYAAGFNAERVYSELKKAGMPKEYMSTGQQRFSSEYGASDVKEYKFPIVTAAIADMATSGSPLFIREDGSIQLEWDFKQFIEQFVSFKRDLAEGYTRFGLLPADKARMVSFYKNMYDNLLALIMPRLAARHTGNFPQIRFPYSPAWFPLSLPVVMRGDATLVRITDTMAMTRTKALAISVIREDKYLKAVLFDTDYIPFEIDIAKEAKPYFIITLPGDVEVYCEKIKTNKRLTIFFQDMGLDFFENKLLYANKKSIYIKELILESKTEGVPTQVCTHVVIDYANKRAYYTDHEKKQFVVYKDEQGIVGPREYFDNYELTYPDPLLTNESIRKKVVKRNEIQSLERVLATKVK